VIEVPEAAAWDHQKQVPLGNGITANKSFNPTTEPHPERRRNEEAPPERGFFMQ